MRRILLVYNPRSSRFADVEQDVISKVRDLKGYLIGKYEVKPTNLEDNISKLSKLLKNHDLVISAGGDATGIIASNSILKSGKDATLAVLPYGNFNDLARTLRTKTLEDIFMNYTWAGDGPGGGPPLSLSEAGEEKVRQDPPRSNFYPLEIWADGKFFRYATCYVTIGMTAESVHIYNQPKLRKKLKKPFGRNVSSYTELIGWYFKNRHKKAFIPEFKLNGELQSPKVSDYAAVNGSSMAKVMKGGEDYLRPKIFRREAAKLTSFWRLFSLMFKSIVSRVPGSDTEGDILEFTSPATVTLQAEGEPHTFKNIKKIEIRKSTKCLKVIKH